MGIVRGHMTWFLKRGTAMVLTARLQRLYELPRDPGALATCECITRSRTVKCDGGPHGVDLRLGEF